MSVPKKKFNEGLKQKLLEFTRTRTFLLDTRSQDYMNKPKIDLVYKKFIDDNTLQNEFDGKLNR